MSSNRYPKPNFWSVEPKAPSLVSLSVRDQNILRPPRRSSSLRAAAIGLKKGLSSQQTSKPVLKASNSCSSLRVGKTRVKVAPSTLRTIHHEPEDELEQRPSYDAGSDDALSEFLDPIISSTNRHSLPISQTSQPAYCGSRYDGPSTGSTETVVGSECHGNRQSSASTLDTTQSKHSAKRLFSKMMTSMHKRRPPVQSQVADDAIEDWRQQTLPRAVRASEGSLETQIRGLDPNVALRENEIGSTTHHHRISTEISAASVSQPDLLPHELGIRDKPAATPKISSESRITSWGTSVDRPEDPTPQLRQPVRIRITARAELGEASLTCKDSLWAMVQIHAEVPEMPALPQARINSIAVAIVLDNSRLATRKDVKKACFEVMALATTLQEGFDSVGVYCTSGTDLADTCLLSLSVPLSLDHLQRKLEEVPNRPRDSYRVQDAFLQAEQALRTLRLQSHQAVPRVKEDIVIITSSALGLSTCFQGDLAGFRVHLVNPSLIPYSNKVYQQLARVKHPTQTSIRGSDSQGESSHTTGHDSLDGWLLDSARCITDDCSDHKSHSLVDAIAYSRSQSDAGRITNVSINIREREDAVIEEVIGDLAHNVLLPGQMVSVPIRIRLDSLASKFSCGSTTELRCSSRISMADAISDLELSLGNYLSELFEVQVSYNHSFFPENTRLEVRESCWLPRNLPLRKTVHYQEDEYDESNQPLQNCRVKKQLALCMASISTPAEALRDIEEFSPEPLSDGVVEFLEALKRRLKHRVALFADVSFMDYILASDYVEQNPEGRGQPYEHFLQEYTDERGSHDEDAPDTPATVVRRRPRPVTWNEELDEEEARKIWQHIRRTSRPGEPPRPNPEVELVLPDDEDPHMEELRSTALKHGRKISTATLRSLAKEFRRDTELIEEEDEPGDELD